VKNNADAKKLSRSSGCTEHQPACAEVVTLYASTLAAADRGKQSGESDDHQNRRQDAEGKFTRMTKTVRKS